MSEFPIALLDDLVAVQLEEATGAANIRLPDWQRSLRGRVIAKGPNTPELHITDRVGFGAATGVESTFDGKLIRIMREREIFAVFHE